MQPTQHRGTLRPNRLFTLASICFAILIAAISRQWSATRATRHSWETGYRSCLGTNLFFKERGRLPSGSLLRSRDVRQATNSTMTRTYCHSEGTSY